MRPSAPALMRAREDLAIRRYCFLQYALGASFQRTRQHQSRNDQRRSVLCGGLERTYRSSEISLLPAALRRPTGGAIQRRLALQLQAVDIFFRGSVEAFAT